MKVIEEKIRIRVTIESDRLLYGFEEARIRDQYQMKYGANAEIEIIYVVPA